MVYKTPPGGGEVNHIWLVAYKGHWDSGGQRTFLSWEQHHKQGWAYVTSFAALSFTDFKKIPIYSRVDKESFSVISWLNRTFEPVTFCS